MRHVPLKHPLPPCALALLAVAASLPAADLAGYKFLVTSVRTGAEMFIADPTTGDMFNVSRQMAIDGSRASWKPHLRAE
jgi:hypothetical protein